MTARDGKPCRGSKGEANSSLCCGNCINSGDSVLHYILKSRTEVTNNSYVGVPNWKPEEWRHSFNLCKIALNSFLKIYLRDREREKKKKREGTVEK